MRSWAARTVLTAVAAPAAIVVVATGAAEAPGGEPPADVSVADPADVSVAEPVDEAVAPVNAVPPNPDAKAASMRRDGESQPPTSAARRGGRSDDGERARGARAGSAAARREAGGGEAAGPAGPAGTDRGADAVSGPRRSPAPMSTWRDAPPADPATCPDGERGVVVDRRWQRAWLCGGGEILGVVPVTTARDQPDPGDYPVYARDWQSFTDATPQRSWLDRFIAFTYGKYEGLRIGFHAVPYYEDGTFLQGFDTVGAQARFGDSDGCIRVLPEHAELLWGFLEVGDVVRILT